MYQNMDNDNTYCVGNYQCEVPQTSAVFIVKIVYVGIWTYILDFFCKKGYTALSWFLVLLPFVLFFLAITTFMMATIDSVGDYL